MNNNTGLMRSALEAALSLGQPFSVQELYQAAIDESIIEDGFSLHYFENTIIGMMLEQGLLIKTSRLCEEGRMLQVA